MAARKTMALLEEGAFVRVVAKQPAEELLKLAREKKIQLIQSAASKEHILDSFLVVLATGDTATDSSLACWAVEKEMLVCSASDPSRGNVHFPAALKKGHLRVAISTEGISPGLSRRLRDQLSLQWGHSLEMGLRWLSEIRDHCLQRIDDEEQRRTLLGKAAEEVSRLLEGENLQEVRESLSSLLPDLQPSYQSEEEEAYGENV